MFHWILGVVLVALGIAFVVSATVAVVLEVRYQVEKRRYRRETKQTDE